MRAIKATMVGALAAAALLAAGLAFGIGGFEPGAGRGSALGPGPVALAALEIEIEIEGGFAVTHLAQVFENRSSQPVTGSYRFWLPPDAGLMSLGIWEDGRWVEATALARRGAGEELGSRVASVVDPALVRTAEARLDGARLEAPLSALAAHGTRRVETSFYQWLPWRSGGRIYVLPLKSGLAGAAGSADEVLISVTARGPGGSKVVEVSYPAGLAPPPTDDDQPERAPGVVFQLALEGEGVKLDRDLVVTVPEAISQSQLTVIAHRPSVSSASSSGSEPGSTADASAGYFLAEAVFVGPRDGATGGKGQSEALKPSGAGRDLAVIFDASLSMTPAKLARGMTALAAIVASLETRDRLALVMLGPDEGDTPPELAGASDAAKRAALDRARNARPAGGTDLVAAFSRALEALPEAGPDQRGQVVAITDGWPTRGEAETEAMVAAIAAANARPHAAIFCLGLGGDANAGLLERLAQESAGSFTWAGADEELGPRLESLIAALAGPPILDVRLTITGAPEGVDLLPPDGRAMFDDQSAVWVGKYREPLASVEFAATGERDGQTVSVSLQTDLPEHDPAHEYLARLWAETRAKRLLAEIKREGEKAEWVEEIVKLGARFNFPTPYAPDRAAGPEAKNFRRAGPAFGREYGGFGAPPAPLELGPELSARLERACFDVEPLLGASCLVPRPPADATARVSALIDQNPDAAGLYLERARADYVLEKFDEAESDLKAYVAKAANKPAAWRVLASFHHERRKTQLEIADLDQLLEALASGPAPDRKAGAAVVEEIVRVAEQGLIPIDRAAYRLKLLKLFPLSLADTLAELEARLPSAPAAELSREIAAEAARFPDDRGRFLALAARLERREGAQQPAASAFKGRLELDAPASVFNAYFDLLESWGELGRIEDRLGTEGGATSDQDRALRFHLLVRHGDLAGARKILDDWRRQEPQLSIPRIGPMAALERLAGRPELAARLLYSGLPRVDRDQRPAWLNELFTALLESREAALPTPGRVAGLFDPRRLTPGPGTSGGVLGLAFDPDETGAALSELAAVEGRRENLRLAIAVRDYYREACPDGPHEVDMDLAIAREFKRLGYHDQAIETAKQFGDQHPNHPRLAEMVRLRAESLFTLGRTEEGAKTLDKLLEGLDPNDPAYLGALEDDAGRRLELGRSAETVGLYWRELGKHPDHAPLYDRFRAVLLDLGLDEEEGKLYRAAAKRLSGAEWRSRLARYYLGKGMVDAYQKSLFEAVADLPETELEKFFSDDFASGRVEAPAPALKAALLRKAHQRYPRNLFFARSFLESADALASPTGSSRYTDADPFLDLAKHALFVQDDLGGRLMERLAERDWLEQAVEELSGQDELNRAEAYFLAVAGDWLSRPDVSIKGLAELAEAYPRVAPIQERWFEKLHGLSRSAFWGDEKADEEARRTLIALAELYPATPDYPARMADVCFLNSKPETALQWLDKLIDQAPGDPDRYRWAAELAWSRSLFREAEARFKLGRERLGRPLLFAAELAALREQQGDLAGAEAELATAIDGSTDLDFLSRARRELARLGRDDLAAKALERSSQLATRELETRPEPEHNAPDLRPDHKAPDRENPCLGPASAFEKAGYADVALQQYLLCVGLDPTDRERLRQAQRFASRHELAAALIQDAREKFELDPTDWRRALVLARLLVFQGEREAALPVYDQALRSAPRSDVLLREKLELLIGAGKFGEAASVQGRLAELFPDDDAWKYEAARMRLLAGDKDAALAGLDELLAASAGHEVCFKAALALERAGAPELASPYLEKGLERFLERATRATLSDAELGDYIRIQAQSGECSKALATLELIYARLSKMEADPTNVWAAPRLRQNRETVAAAIAGPLGQAFAEHATLPDQVRAATWLAGEAAPNPPPLLSAARFAENAYMQQLAASSYEKLAAQAGPADRKDLPRLAAFWSKRLDWDRVIAAPDAEAAEIVNALFWQGKEDEAAARLLTMARSPESRPAWVDPALFELSARGQAPGLAEVLATPDRRSTWANYFLERDRFEDAQKAVSLASAPAWSFSKRLLIDAKQGTLDPGLGPEADATLALAPIGATLARPLDPTARLAGHDRAAALMTLAEGLYHRGDREQARGLWDAAVEERPADPKAYRYVGQTLLGLGEFAEAEARFRRALALDPQDRYSKYGLAKALVREGKNDQALPLLYTIADESDPAASRQDVMFEYHAMLLLGFKAAAPTVLKTWPEWLSSESYETDLDHIAWVDEMVESVDDNCWAIPFFEEYRPFDLGSQLVQPKDRLVGLVAYLVNQDRFEDAKAALRKMSEVFAGDPAALNRAAEGAERVGLFELAAKLRQEAQVLDPLNAKSRMKSIMDLMALNRTDEAGSALAAFLVSPRYPFSAKRELLRWEWTTLAGKPDGVAAGMWLEQFLRLVKEDVPGQEPLALGIAIAALNSGETAMADEIFKKTAISRPAYAYYFIGERDRRAGQLAAARDAYRAGLWRDPEDGLLRFSLAEAWLADDPRRALAVTLGDYDLIGALARDPSQTSAKARTAGLALAASGLGFERGTRLAIGAAGELARRGDHPAARDLLETYRGALDPSSAETAAALVELEREMERLGGEHKAAEAGGRDRLVITPGLDNGIEWGWISSELREPEERAP